MFGISLTVAVERRRNEIADLKKKIMQKWTLDIKITTMQRKFEQRSHLQ